jgi:putative ABC transport system ATP-binding protein
MSDNEHILIAEDLHKAYGAGRARVPVLRGLDLRVRAGEFLAVMGPSGCGKTTLLHVLGLMSRPDAGRIILDGRDLAPARPAARAAARRGLLGFVFQRLNLISVLSGRDNIGLSLKVRGIRPDDRIDRLLEAFGVTDVAGRKPGELSLGEQQRVAVAMAIAHRPRVLLADEPTGSLDSARRADLLDLLRRTNREDGQAIVLITHSETVAAAADRVARMQDGIIAEGH